MYICLVIFGLVLIVVLIAARLGLIPTKRELSTTAMTVGCMVSIVIVGIGLRSNVKVSGAGTTVELTPEVVENIEKLRTAINQGNLPAAMEEFNEFREKLINTSNAPGIATGLIDRMSLDQINDMKQAFDRASPTPTVVSPSHSK